MDKIIERNIFENLIPKVNEPIFRPEPVVQQKQEPRPDLMASQELEIKTTRKLEWIRNLVKAEESLEKSSLVDLQNQMDPDRVLAFESLKFLLKLKTEILDAITAFNDLKESSQARIKLYGVAKTPADFMIFRNGYKMIISLKEPGKIGIRMNFVGTHHVPHPGMPSVSLAETNDIIEEILLESYWCPFYEIKWAYKQNEFSSEYLVKYLIMLFVRESGK